MRSLIFIAIATVASACGVPEVDTPEGNNAITSDQPTDKSLPAPKVNDASKSYPYRKLVLRGNAPNGARVIVRGAGNPATGTVQPIENSFCVVVDLEAPAHYTLTVQSQSEDGRLSDPTEVSVTRDPNAPAQTDLKLCDGSPVS